MSDVNKLIMSEIHGHHCFSIPVIHRNDLILSLSQIQKLCKYGKAADLHSSKSPEEMARVAEEVLGNTGEISIYSWGIHVGVNCRYSRYRG